MISVLSQFTIPFGPIPLTLQTLMIGIIGTIYKPSHAFVTVCLYLFLGFFRFSSICRRCWWCFAFPWSYCWFPPSSSHSEHGSRLLFTNAKSSIFTIFLANLLSSALLCVRSYRLYAGHAYRSPKAFTLVVAPFILADLIKLVIITITSKAIFASLKHHWYFK